MENNTGGDTGGNSYLLLGYACIPSKDGSRGQAEHLLKRGPWLSWIKLAHLSQ